jgi:hypothetical protein
VCYEQEDPLPQEARESFLKASIPLPMGTKRLALPEQYPISRFGSGQFVAIDEQPTLRKAFSLATKVRTKRNSVQGGLDSHSHFGKSS